MPLVYASLLTSDASTRQLGQFEVTFLPHRGEQFVVHGAADAKSHLIYEVEQVFHHVSEHGKPKTHILVKPS